MFSRDNGLILLAIASAENGCPIPEIYWRTGFIDRAVPSRESIRDAVEVGLATGLLGYEREGLVLSEFSKKMMIERAKATGPGDASSAVAAWLTEQFPNRVNNLFFELKEEKGDDSFRYGISSLEWRVLDGTSEVSVVAYLK